MGTCPCASSSGSICTSSSSPKKWRIRKSGSKGRPHISRYRSRAVASFFRWCWAAFSLSVQLGQAATRGRPGGANERLRQARSNANW
ncbi:MAG: hypothetical protein MUC33_21780 [Desulfobacterales bacterium]|nr:hypothetical protein [Desulfobacterales bacterium]